HLSPSPAHDPRRPTLDLSLPRQLSPGPGGRQCRRRPDPARPCTPWDGEGANSGRHSGSQRRPAGDPACLQYLYARCPPAGHGRRRRRYLNGRNGVLSSMKAIWNGATLAERDTTIVVEGNHYFPPDAINRNHFDPTDTPYTCSWN